MGNEKEKVIITFNNRSKYDDAIANWEDKIVLVGVESNIKKPEIGTPYMCEFIVYDTAPDNPVKGSRIVNVLYPMVVDGFNYKKTVQGIEITLYCRENSVTCLINSSTFDPRRELKKCMQELQCKVDYNAIDKILHHIEGENNG